MAKLSTPVVFKWQNRRKLLSSNDKAVGTYGKTVNTYSLQKAKLSHLLFSSDKPLAPLFFKRQYRCGWRTPPTPHSNQFQPFHDSGR
jgi:hypothetical protein